MKKRGSWDKSVGREGERKEERRREEQKIEFEGKKVIRENYEKKGNTTKKNGKEGHNNEEKKQAFSDVLSLKALKSVESCSVLPIKIYYHAKQPSENMFPSTAKQNVSMSVSQNMLTCL